jgi:serine/threonine-protein kinase Chk1
MAKATSSTHSLSQYSIFDTIGEGSFGCVKLAVNNSTQQKVAIKTVPKSIVAAELIEKEFLLHKAVSGHENLIKMHFKFEDDDFHYLVMELAAGGELFDRIEPEVGFGNEHLAHAYFRQIVAALEYVHGKGIVHRDLKPENVLLDENGILKLTDFGVATLFTYKGVRRKIQVKCGSELYMAPQVFSNAVPFEGDKADIWSLGVILFVMLRGSLPWERPDAALCSQYAHFLNIGGTQFFRSTSEELTDLLAKLLDPQEETRISLAQIKEHSWFNRSNPLICPSTGTINSNTLMKMLLTPATDKDDVSMHQNGQDEVNVSSCGLLPLSQPEKFGFSQMTMSANLTNYSPSAMQDSNFCSIFSQPIQQLPLFASSQMATSNAMMTSQEEMQQFGGQISSFALPSMRLTRFSTPLEMAIVMQRLLELMDAFLVQAKVVGRNGISFHTVDSRKCILTGQVVISPFGGQHEHLVIFRKSRGDSIEFKRLFYALYAAFNESN